MQRQKQAPKEQNQTRDLWITAPESLFLLFKQALGQKFKRSRLHYREEKFFGGLYDQKSSSSDHKPSIQAVWQKKNLICFDSFISFLTTDGGDVPMTLSWRGPLELLTSVADVTFK